MVWGLFLEPELALLLTIGAPCAALGLGDGRSQTQVGGLVLAGVGYFCFFLALSCGQKADVLL